MAGMPRQPRSHSWDSDGWLSERGSKSLPAESVGPTPADLTDALVVGVGSKSCLLRVSGEELRARRTIELAVGDIARYSPSLQVVGSVRPRRGVLSRPDPHNLRVRLVIAANVDIVVNVVSLVSPPLRVGLIDRYLVAIERAGARPLICVNKADLGGRAGQLSPYAEMGVPVLFCSAVEGAGIAELRTTLAGQVCVLTGHSGVGKSSLLNALAPDERAVTGDVNQSVRKGRHTTTSSRLYDLPGGGMIIDTPGIREFGLWDVTAADLRLYFHDFDEFALECAFGDCSHTHEPRCGVKRALESGELSAGRYESYLRIMASTAADATQR